MLDLGCGTGADAVHLAERGVEVVGIDPSAAMIELATRRADGLDFGCGKRPRFVRVSAEDVVKSVGLREIVTAGGGREIATAEGNREVATGDHIRKIDFDRFDGVLSNFGVLNCLDPAALRSLAGALAGLCRPGAPWVSVTMGRFCAWESIWYGLHGRFRRAFRRRVRDGVEADLGAGPLRVHYHTIRSIATAASPWFAPVEQAAIGALIPPTYAGGWIERRPRTLASLARVERHVAEYGIVAGAADHVLLTLVRNDL